MKLTQELLETYVERGLLNRSVNGDCTLYCYSKETFFGGHWDDVTKACRGLVFYKGEQVNHPFPKIFNLDETPETSFDAVMGLINSGEHYTLCHKVNGHLTIVDYIVEADKFLVHTKGSLQDNEMIQNDKEMFFTQHCDMIEAIRANRVSMTFMFESLHESDPHTLYDQEVQRYGKNQLVLLGGYYRVVDNNIWRPLPQYSLESWANYNNIPLVQFFDEVAIDPDKIKSMFKEIDTEGYVIWFPSLDFRVKIKTTDYWKMRFRKELSADSIIDRFVTSGDGRLYSRYPEEVADKVVDLIEFHFTKFLTDFIRNIPYNHREMSNKDIGLSDKFTKMQKSLIFAMKDGKVVLAERFMRNKSFRVAFKDFMDLDCNEHLKTHIKDSLITYIEKREA